MFTQRRLVILASLLLVTALLAAQCVAPATPEKIVETVVVKETVEVEVEVVVTATPEPAPERGTFRETHWAQWAGKESLDPLSPTRFLPAVYFLYDRLCGVDEKGLPVPELAVSWEADATAQRWTFKLREGVTFHDGKPFTSAPLSQRCWTSLTAKLSRRRTTIPLCSI
jgi:ABC-type transport system substrate-binding protein